MEETREMDRKKKLLKRVLNSWKKCVTRWTTEFHVFSSRSPIVKHYLRPCQQMLLVGVQASNGKTTKIGAFIVAATMLRCHVSLHRASQTKKKRKKKKREKYWDLLREVLTLITSFQPPTKLT